MTETGRKRPWLAALLAFVPGAGHVYLNEWLRALVWFGLVASTPSLLISDTAAEPLRDGLTQATAVAFLQNVPVEAWVALLAVTLLSMADAFWMATRENVEADVVEGAKCPNCGMELDEDIDFCHWCTTKLDYPSEE